MDSYIKALVTFLFVYLVGLVTGAIVGKEKEQRTLLEGLKDQTNHKTAAIVALVVAGSRVFSV